MDTRVASPANSCGKGSCLVGRVEDLWTSPHGNISVLLVNNKNNPKKTQKNNFSVLGVLSHLLAGTHWERGQEGAESPCQEDSRSQDVREGLENERQRNDLFQPCGDVQGKERREEHGGETTR